ncbi:ABC transporter substrate-binding protein [soil metagenome]|uniref:4,5-dihydroxyphthalate decarboxylase n=1 Tax=Mycolicibacterium lacusdiani TaxID=2895283 RepID=UPI001F4154DE|nr:4,5-dihydroxyphthalate decarboxylase [Mycolicibacterium lacusdiani]
MSGLDRLELTYGGELYDRTRRLYTGEVAPEGVRLRYLHTAIEDLFWRQGRYGEFDLAEYSMGAYLSTLDDPDRPFVALPVFPSRLFRHSSVYVNADTDVSDVADLNGTVIGTPEWSMTASLWMRGILGEHHGVDLASIHWRTGGLEEPGRLEKAPVTPPAHFDVAHIGDTDTLSAQLIRGDLTALITARAPRAFLEGDRRIRRLWPDFRAAEQAYYVKTQIIPIMHVVVIRRALLAAHPWVANNLVDAFERARTPVQRELLDTAVCTSSLVWESSYAEAEQAVLGDPFRCGVAANAASLEALLAYAHQQGFSRRRLAPEDVFVPSTVSAAKI